MSKMSIELEKYTRADRPLVRQTLNGSTMGTRYSAVFYMPPVTNVSALAAALFEAVDRVDRQMSTWKPNSDLNRLNASPLHTWVSVPRELMAVLATSLQIEHATNGAFDIGVGNLVSAWGFGPSADRPSRDQNNAVSSAARLPASKVLELNVREGLARQSASIKLDLSGIAKGYGVDEMARVMNEYHIPSWLVGIDGEMRAKGANPDGTMWAVAHERPDRNVREAMGVLELQDMAVATSGNYRHFREVDGRIVSHTMNPRTGAPTENGLASVTVLAPNCMTADAWATALMVMGVEIGLEIARVHRLEVIFVLQDGSVESTL